VPVKGGAGLAEGIELFPRQDALAPDEFGNAIRGPLGIHRAAGKRYWFYGADYKVEAQLKLPGAAQEDRRNGNAALHCGSRNAGGVSPQTESRTATVRSKSTRVSHSGFRSRRAQALRKLIGLVARHARSKERIGAEITWQSLSLILASTSAGQGVRER